MIKRAINRAVIVFGLIALFALVAAQYDYWVWHVEGWPKAKFLQCANGGGIMPCVNNRAIYASEEPSVLFQDSNGAITWSWVALIDLNHREVRPIQIILSKSMPNTGYSGRFYETCIEQTHYYVNGVLTARPSPVLVGAGITMPFHGTGTTIRNISTELAGWGSKPADQRTGKYRVSIRKDGGTSGATLANFVLVNDATFDYEDDYDPGSNGGGSGGGGGESDTPGFWENLFVPSEEALDDYAAAVEQFLNWGPLGIYNFLNDDVWDFVGAGTGEYTLSFTVPMFGDEVFTFDGSPYEPFIKMMRWTMSGGLWYGVFFRLYRRFVHGGSGAASTE